MADGDNGQPLVGSVDLFDFKADALRMLFDVSQLLPRQAGEVDCPTAISIGDGHDVCLVRTRREAAQPADLIAPEYLLTRLPGQDLHGASVTVHP